MWLGLLKFVKIAVDKIFSGAYVHGLGHIGDDDHPSQLKSGVLLLH